MSRFGVSGRRSSLWISLPPIRGIRKKDSGYQEERFGVSGRKIRGIRKISPSKKTIFHRYYSTLAAFHKCLNTYLTPYLTPKAEFEDEQARKLDGIYA